MRRGPLSAPCFCLHARGRWQDLTTHNNSCRYGPVHAQVGPLRRRSALTTVKDQEAARFWRLAFGRPARAPPDGPAQ
eukprot:3546906-Pyramimonas_sp.AAC.1